jgi:uncharacterized protein YjiS (DUF1127 family)
MQTIRLFPCAPNRGGPNAAVVAGRRAVLQLVQKLRAPLRAWWARRATRSALGRVDDRMLKDIGIHRSQIDSVAITPMADRTTRHRRLTAYASRLTTTARYGPTNAPWIDEAIKIDRDDLFR